ncbi:MAG: acyl-CoA synthetase [Rhodospirillales bacterium]|nr:acyl-CoA synthetase [Rhodospirillales bacterium]
MLDAAATYEACRENFRWSIPATYNIGVDVCDRHCGPGGKGEHTALIVEDENGQVGRTSFARLKSLSNCLANALAGLGVGKGDRVGILLSQSLETALAHIATYKLGAVAVPLFTLFGPDGLEFRLADSGAKVLVTDMSQIDKIETIRDRLPDLKAVLAIGAKRAPKLVDFWAALMSASDAFEPVATLASDPAIIIYTSGTTGQPKGALHAHRVLLGHLPGVEFPHEFFPKQGDLFWTPADWAWIGGLFDVLLPALHHGVPVLAHRARKFDPDFAFGLMARHGVRNVFLPPTALKLMRQAGPPKTKPALRSVGSGGETLGAEILEWGKAALGVTINEFYGQTECNLVVGNCAGLMAVKPGSMGRAIPGHQVAIVDEAGQVLNAGQTGHIAVREGDPAMFLGYWNNPQGTAQKFAGDWMLSGDTGRQDEDGYFWFQGRADDVITSAGYRIGPGEIEDCLLKHPAVAMAAAIGVPDPLRTEIVKAFLVLKPDQRPADQAAQQALAESIKAFVRDRLAAHEYPRQVEFVDSLPLTATGKIMRKDLRALEAQRTKSGDR